MDVDIDLANRQDLLDKIVSVPARLENRKHNTGVYTHRVPVDPLTGMCTYDYKSADDVGFFKLDLLNVSIYKDVRDEQHLIELMNREPIWELLEHEEFVDQVFHISGHVGLLKKLQPRTVLQLAAALAIIRPSKRYLENASWDKIYSEVWTEPENGSYYFKKAHAVSYAMAVVVHMNLLCEQLGY
jgi:hypothetical protein